MFSHLSTTFKFFVAPTSPGIAAPPAPCGAFRSWAALITGMARPFTHPWPDIWMTMARPQRHQHPWYRQALVPRRESMSPGGSALGRRWTGRVDCDPRGLQDTIPPLCGSWPTEAEVRPALLQSSSAMRSARTAGAAGPPPDGSGEQRRYFTVAADRPKARHGDGSKPGIPPSNPSVKD